MHEWVMMRAKSAFRLGLYWAGMPARAPREVRGSPRRVGAAAQTRNASSGVPQRPSQF